jgi:hypothetical protein
VLSVFAIAIRAASKIKWAPLKSVNIQKLLPYAIGSVAMFWMIQRVAAF